MAYLQEIYENKTAIIKLLVNSESIVDTINNMDIETSDELIGQNIFRDLYIPDVASTAKTYICIGIFAPNIIDKLIKNVNIYFWVFSHQDIMDTGKGYTRVDFIQSEIDKIMNGNYNFGIDNVNLKYSKPFKPNAKFGGVELLYQVEDLNQDGSRGFDNVKPRQN